MNSQLRFEELFERYEKIVTPKKIVRLSSENRFQIQ
jgi:hypothetical protein